MSLQTTDTEVNATVPPPETTLHPDDSVPIGTLTLQCPGCAEYMPRESKEVSTELGQTRYTFRCPGCSSAVDLLVPHKS